MEEPRKQPVTTTLYYNYFSIVIPSIDNAFATYYERQDGSDIDKYYETKIMTDSFVDILLCGILLLSGTQTTEGITRYKKLFNTGKLSLYKTLQSITVLDEIGMKHLLCNTKALQYIGTGVSIDMIVHEPYLKRLETTDIVTRPCTITLNPVFDYCISGNIVAHPCYYIKTHKNNTISKRLRDEDE